MNYVPSTSLRSFDAPITTGFHCAPKEPFSHLSKLLDVGGPSWKSLEALYKRPQGASVCLPRTRGGSFEAQDDVHSALSGHHLTSTARPPSTSYVLRRGAHLICVQSEGRLFEWLLHLPAAEAAQTAALARGAAVRLLPRQALELRLPLLP